MIGFKCPSPFYQMERQLIQNCSSLKSYAISRSISISRSGINRRHVHPLIRFYTEEPRTCPWHPAMVSRLWHGDIASPFPLSGDESYVCNRDVPICRCYIPCVFCYCSFFPVSLVATNLLSRLSICPSGLCWLGEAAANHH